VLDEYKRFLLRGNVVDLAVGVVAGAAFGAVVASVVSDIINPLIAGIFGKPDFSDIVFDVSGGEVAIGNFLNAVVTFFLTMTAVFFLIVKPVGLATSRFLARDDEAGPRMRECPRCISQIPATATRCAQCCADIAPATA
jgi:large conductance mechanosensitive channel